VPRIGDGVEAEGYRLSVEELDGRRVTMVRYVPRAGNGPNPQ
jgi:CBS domain containing-hemolysin-like protein